MEGNYTKIIPIVLLLGLIALITGAMAITNSSFADTVTNKCYNSSYVIMNSGQACNSTSVNISIGSAGEDGLNLSTEYYTIMQGQSALTTIAKQQPTIAIISVMVIIILALMSVFTVIGIKKGL